MRVLIVAAASLAISQAARAQDQVPFPELDTPTYCTILVSKMLDENEKKTELEKCLAEEKRLKEVTRSYWSIVNLKTQQYMTRVHFKEPRDQTYVTVYGYVATAIGHACMTTYQLDCRAR